jgi:hypothetical protein
MLARRGRRYPQGAHAGAVCASLRLRCGARLGVAPQTRFAHFVRYAQTDAAKSVLDARCARRLQGCAPRRPRNRPLRVPPAALQRLWSSLRTPSARLGTPEMYRNRSGRPFADRSCFFLAENRTVGARQGAPGGGDFWGDEQHRPGVGARSAHPKLTRRVCLSGVSAANAASSAARPQAEQHSAVGAKRRPPQHEPPAGAACRAAPDVARIAHAQRSATGRKRAFSAALTLRALQVASRGVQRLT